VRKTITAISFLVVGARAVGTAALDDVRLQGSDALVGLTKSVLGNCPGADPAPGDQAMPPVPWDMNGLYYDGGGSIAGESRMKIGAQTVAPMSRFLDAENTCSGSGPTAEGLVFALESLSVVTSEANGSACNGALDDCDTGSDPTSGAAFAKTITLPDMSTYTFNGWRDVLRVLFAGMDHDAGNAYANRNCNSAVRQAIANNWGNFFEGPCTGCTQIEHAFRPDDESPVTDMFIDLLGLPAIVRGNVGSIDTPFCNAVLLSEPLPVNVNRPPPDFQDRDPIRRLCTGTNNSVGAFGNPPANVATKQVCAAKKSLGLVVPVHPIDFLASAESFPNTQCFAGRFMFGAAPKQLNATGTGLTSIGARCPNGDISVFGGSCLIPTTESGDPRCLAAFNSRPAFVFDSSPVDGQAMSGADGRVYNLHLRKANGTYQVESLRGFARPIMGAYYRIHSTRTLSGPDYSINTCNVTDSSSQIGCLEHASPCSVGFGGRSAGSEPGTTALKVNGVAPATACVRSLAYPLARKLYLNTMIGFENVTGQERSLAECFAGSGLSAGTSIDAIASSFGFTTLGASPYCEDFNEVANCGAADPNTNACANNEGAVPGASTSTTCGNGVVELLEECDEGPLNGTAGHCTTTCRLPPA
jgi:hypothetical protein